MPTWLLTILPAVSGKAPMMPLTLLSSVSRLKEIQDHPSSISMANCRSVAGAAHNGANGGNEPSRSEGGRDGPRGKGGDRVGISEGRSGEGSGGKSKGGGGECEGRGGGGVSVEPQKQAGDAQLGQ